MVNKDSVENNSGQETNRSEKIGTNNIWLETMLVKKITNVRKPCFYNFPGWFKCDNNAKTCKLK